MQLTQKMRKLTMKYVNKYFCVYSLSLMKIIMMITIHALPSLWQLICI